MALGTPLLKLLNKPYPASTFIEMRFKKYDIGFTTDEDGDPILLFIGRKENDGRIRGHRYARRLVKDVHGKIIKDHWDDKGSVY